jgi:hypothetical protein
VVAALVRTDLFVRVVEELDVGSAIPFDRFETDSTVAGVVEQVDEEAAIVERDGVVRRRADGTGVRCRR